MLHETVYNVCFFVVVLYLIFKTVNVFVIFVSIRLTKKMESQEKKKMEAEVRNGILNNNNCFHFVACRYVTYSESNMIVFAWSAVWYLLT